MKRFTIWFTITFILVLSIVVAGCSSSPKVNYDAFAKCITEKGATMYGAFWCPHCTRVKKNFGSSFKYVDYVECDPRGDNSEPERCRQVGIDKYATFIINGNPDKSTWLVGEPSMESLSQATGCPLPTAHAK
ncbi:hypothetical protein HZB03_05160 [Candidatus Woesearchaeota archaeon]|nr:hypothetical protein [Candidatus Woesearchaeota archaeon]